MSMFDLLCTRTYNYRLMTGELNSTPYWGATLSLTYFTYRPPSASTYYDENPIKWVMHGVFGVYSTNSYFSFLFSFDVLTHNGHFCLLGLFLSLDYVYIITGIQLFVKGLKESFLNITKSITLEGIEPSLFYSTTTKPPGAGQHQQRGSNPFSVLFQN